MRSRPFGSSSSRVARSSARGLLGLPSRRSSARSSSARHGSVCGGLLAGERVPHERLDVGAQRLALLGREERARSPLPEREPRARRARARPRRRRAEQLRGQPLGRQRVEAHELAARDHRLEHPAERVGQRGSGARTTAGSSSVFSIRLATSSFIVSTRSSTNTRLRDSNGVRVAADDDRLLDVVDAHHVRAGRA